MVSRATLNSKKRRRRILSISVVVAILAFVLVLYLVIQASNSNPGSQNIGMPVSQTIMQELTGVSNATLASVGSGGVILPARISGPSLTSGGKPEILYVGGEFCPYCAVERWGLIIALSRFGQFSGLEYMQSSSTDVNPDTPTFTFANAVYTSKYVTFVAVEEYDRNDNVRQSLTADQQSLVTQYDSCAGTGQSGSIPFVDFANAYAVNCGAQPSIDLMGDNWTSVASQLDNPGSSVAVQLDGAANTIITAICKIDGGQPSSVCLQPYATLTLAYSASGAVEAQNSVLVVPTETVGTSWTESARRS